MNRLGFHHPALDDAPSEPAQYGPGVVHQMNPPDDGPGLPFGEQLSYVRFAAEFVRDVGIGIAALILAWRYKR